MNRSGWRLAGFLLALALAAALRLPRLSARPMHGDEAVHAYKLDELLRTGRYVYDPHEFHGPTLYYLTLPVTWLRGAADTRDLDESDLRLVPALFGVATLLLVWSLRRELGRAGTFFAALLTAASPALSFYSRYYIQETLLSFFVLGALAFGWRYAASRRRIWALAAGVCLGCAHASKETSVIAFGCLAAAVAIVVGLHRLRRPGAALRDTNELRSARAALFDVLLAGLVAVAASVTFYSAFFTNASGPLDSLRALVPYVVRAGGHGAVAPHDKPWHDYLATLLYTHTVPGPTWSESLVVALATLGSVATLGRRRLGGTGVSPVSMGGVGGREAAPDSRSADVPPAHRAQSAGFAAFLTAYAALLCLAYSAIPYKTPWCLVQMLQPLALLAGIGAAALLDFRVGWRWKAGATTFLLLLSGQLAGQAYRANFVYFADRRNPYVYAHPVPDVANAGAWVERIAACAEEGRGTLVEVYHPNPWPLPWYLRRLTHVGYWETPPDRPAAPIVVADENYAAALDGRYGRGYQLSVYGLRPAERLLVYVRDDLYRRFADPFRTSSAATVPGERP
ncbi:MAG: TIGR03663 family protein [Phycisphaerae bacterium]|jgi:uncharacterized protein (TIGR03663 family)